MVTETTDADESRATRPPTSRICTCCGHAYPINPFLSDRCWSCDGVQETRRAVRAAVELVPDPYQLPDQDGPKRRYLVLVLGYVHGGSLPEREAVIHHGACSGWSEAQLVDWFTTRKGYPTWYAENGQVAA